MDPNLVRGLAAHLQRLSSSLASSLPAQIPAKHLAQRNPNLHTSQSPQRDIPRTNRSTRPHSRFKQSSELSPVPHNESSSPIISLLHSHQVHSETNPLGLQELQEPSKQLMPSQLPLKASREYPSCFSSQSRRYEDEAEEKENIPGRREQAEWLHLLEKARTTQDENQKLKQEIERLTECLEGSVTRAQLCQIEAQCQLRESQAVRRIQGVAAKLLQFGGLGCSAQGGHGMRGCSFSSLREALSLPPSEVNSVLCSARSEEVKSLEEVVSELEKNLVCAEDATNSRERMKQELQGRMVKQVRESLRDELNREREEHSRREEEVVRRVRQQQSVKSTFETEQLREEIQRLRREAEGGEYESEMFILRCENDRLAQKLEKKEQRHVEELRRMAQEIEEIKQAKKRIEEQNKQSRREAEISGVLQAETKEKLKVAEDLILEREKEGLKLTEELEYEKQKKKQAEKLLEIEREEAKEGKGELEKIKRELEWTKEELAREAVEKERVMEKQEEIMKETVNEAVQRVEEQWEGRVELVKQMGKEKAEEMRKVHERVLSETELALEKQRKQRAVQLERARLEGRQEEEKARLEVAKELQALKQSEMKYMEGNQRLLAAKFKSQLERMKTLLQKLAARHLNSAACSKDFFQSDLHEVKDGLAHLEKKLHMQFKTQKREEEEKKVEVKCGNIELTNLDPSVSMENPLLSMKSDQGIMIPSSPATEKKEQRGCDREMQSEETNLDWDQRVCLRCGGNSRSGACKFHPYRTHQGVSALLYTDIWNQCREQCLQKEKACYSQISHFYGEKIPYKRRVKRTAFLVENAIEQGDIMGRNCSRGTATVKEGEAKGRGREMKSQRDSVDQRQSLDRAQIRQAMRSVRERMQHLQSSTKTEI